jgi:hypothetical protein
MNRFTPRLVPLIGIVAVGACRSDRGLPLRKDAGGPPAGVAAATIPNSVGPAECGGAGGPTTCFVDTAQTPPNAIPGEDYPQARWIFFAAAGDSITVSVDSSASITTNFGQEKVGRITASFYHKRLAQDGVLTVDVSTRQFPQGETPAYAIRFQQIASSTSAPLRPTNQRALLTVGAPNEAERYAVIPLSQMQGLRNPSSWEIYQGNYRVALVADSLYVVCRKQCSIADTVKLTPGARARAFR